MQARVEALECAPYFARLGARVAAIGSGAAEVAAAFLPSHSNTLGAVHGGVSASLALWSAALASWSSQYDPRSDLAGRVLSVHINYLAAARAEGLSARARVLARGRETVHAAVDVFAGEERTVATATVIYRIAKKTAQVAPDFVTSRTRWQPAAAAGEQPGPPLSLLSPYSNAAGLELLSADRDGAVMRVPLAGNEGPDGSIDAGALLGCIDTCAALSCTPFLKHVPARSSTLSMSVVLGVMPQSQVMLTGCLRGRDEEAFTAGVETLPDPSGRCFADASVLYRLA